MKFKVQWQQYGGIICNLYIISKIMFLITVLLKMSLWWKKTMALEKFYHRIKRKIFLFYCSWQNKSKLPSIFWKDRLQAAYWLQMYLLPIAHHDFRVILLYLKIFKIFFLDTFLSYNFLVGMTFSFKPGSLPFTLQDKILISLLGTLLEGS